MDSITKLSEVNFLQWFLWTCLILAAIVAIYALVMKIFELFGIEFKWVRKRREDHELILKTSQELADLRDRHDKDAEESAKHEKEINEKLHQFADDVCVQMKTISDNVNTMSADIEKRFNENDERMMKRVRAELKDRIGQLYRSYHSSGKINDMEWDALQDLITEYEDNGGKNSFVHDTVLTEMYTWERV